MGKSLNDQPPKKKSHALRKLIGTVAVAGAVYAAEKFMESKRKKKTSGK